MLLTKTVKVKWHGSNKKHYISKGYTYTKMGDEFEAKIQDLSDGCNSSYVNVICDKCGKLLENIDWYSYKKHKHENNKYYCVKCVKEVYSVKKQKETKLLNSESFYDWSYKNLPNDVAEEIIARWDYELNKCSPMDVTFCSAGIDGKGYYFKCLNHPEHGSELKNIANFTTRKDGELNCKACNSIGQYIIDLYEGNGLRDYWDYEKNNALDLDPFKISKGSHTKIYIFCQIHKYHGSYPIICSNFIKGNRCSYCSNKNEKIHPLDSLGQYIVDNYGQEFLDKVWSGKNKKSPFEYAPMSSQEVYWKCLDSKHEDYLRMIKRSNLLEFRCPKCSYERTESILEEKTRLYLESLNYKVLTEHSCSIVPINPKTKHPFPFDNEIKLVNNKNLIVEVMGSQHYQELPKINNWLNGLTPKEHLHKIRLHDRYKRFVAYKKGYEYLELPYWVFGKKESYKKLINDKINEILNNNSNNIDTKVS